MGVCGCPVSPAPGSTARAISPPVAISPAASIPPAMAAICRSRALDDRALALLLEHDSEAWMADADPQLTAQATIAAMATRARAAAAVLAGSADADKAAALRSAAAAIRAAAPAILAANAGDMARARDAGLPGALLDRLLLDERRVAAMADGVEAVAALADPVGQVIDASERPNGLKLSRVRVPIGVIGIVYESRPNVTADAAALCVRSGNAVILRGGSEASASNRAIHAALAEGLAAGGLPADAVQLVGSTDRALVGAMLKAAGLIDLIVPRGGKGLVARVQEEARVPVLAHLDGINHVYVHASADPAMAEAIVVDAKMRRTGICGAMETLLIDRGFAEPERLVRALRTAGCEVRGDADVQMLDPAVVPGKRRGLGMPSISTPSPRSRWSTARTLRWPTSHVTVPTIPTRSSPPTPPRPSASSPKSIRRSCCGTPPPSSPMAASSGWGRKSASPLAVSMPADRSRWKG